ncbi:MAG: adenosylcobinamide-GDP ribazoletransferase [Methyloglobulus sp.]|nr:adenosylcobinamide-GDP ribazoletransferase [Methyloglobulus sp.]
MSQFKLFLLAISFYTRLPTPNHLDYSHLSKANIYLPLVGWIIGGISAICFYLSDQLWSQNTAVIVALSAGIFLTGAFHEDGFADVCDGFGGGYDRQQILKIMKDSQIGTYGAIGLILLMATKLNILSTLPAPLIPWLLIAAHSWSRFQPLLLMQRFDYARTDLSKAKLAASKPSSSELFVAGIIALLPVLLLPISCILTLPITLFVNGCLGHYFFRHIGGYTGDCLGASQQVAEVVFYLCIDALWTFI